MITHGLIICRSNHEINSMNQAIPITQNNLINSRTLQVKLLSHSHSTCPWRVESIKVQSFHFTKGIRIFIRGRPPVCKRVRILFAKIVENVKCPKNEYCIDDQRYDDQRIHVISSRPCCNKTTTNGIIRNHSFCCEISKIERKCSQN